MMKESEKWIRKDPLSGETLMMWSLNLAERDCHIFQNENVTTFLYQLMVCVSACQLRMEDGKKTNGYLRSLIGLDCIDGLARSRRTHRSSAGGVEAMNMREGLGRPLGVGVGSCGSAPNSVRRANDCGASLTGEDLPRDRGGNYTSWGSREATQVALVRR